MRIVGFWGGAHPHIGIPLFQGNTNVGMSRYYYRLSLEEHRPRPGGLLPCEPPLLPLTLSQELIRFFMPQV
jgi:hypothetical protein